MYPRLARLVAAVAILALLSVGLGRGARIAAQDGGSESLPLIGTPVSIVGTDGSEVALVTVTGIEDPWEDFEPGSEPDRSYRYVLLHVEIENTGSRPYAAGTFGIGLLDSEGFLSHSTYLPRSSEQVEADPDLSFDDVPAGDTISGVLGYLVLESADLVRAVYQPAYDRLIFLADLTQEGSATTSDDDEADAESSPVADDENDGNTGAESGDGAASGGPDADTDDGDTDDADDAASGGPSDDADTEDADSDDADADTAAVDVSDEDCDASQEWIDSIASPLGAFSDSFEDLTASDTLTAGDLEDAAADLRDAADTIRDSDPPAILENSNEILADAIDAYADAYLDVAESNDEISSSDFFSTVDLSAGDELFEELDTVSGPTLDACGIDA